MIGVGNLVLMPWDSGTAGGLTFGLMLNVLLFVVPGLIVYGLGARMASKPTVKQDAVVAPSVREPRSVESRLESLRELKEKKLISDEEFSSRRQRILEDI